MGTGKKVGGGAPSKACSLYPKHQQRASPTRQKTLENTTLLQTAQKALQPTATHTSKGEWGAQTRPSQTEMRFPTTHGGHLREDRFHPHQALYGDLTEPGVPPSPCSALLTLLSAVVLETGLPPHTHQAVTRALPQRCQQKPCGGPEAPPLPSSNADSPFRWQRRPSGEPGLVPSLDSNEMAPPCSPT